MPKPDLDTLRDLLRQVEAAGTPDRDIDAQVWWAFAPHEDDSPETAEDVRRFGISAAMDDWWGRQWRSSGEHPAWVTTSTDAAVAWFKRVLPGWSYCIRESGFGGGDATIHNPMLQPMPGCDTRFQHAAGPSLALIAATLTALIAEGGRADA